MLALVAFVQVRLQELSDLFNKKSTKEINGYPKGYPFFFFFLFILQPLQFQPLQEHPWEAVLPPHRNGRVLKQNTRRKLR